MPQSMSIGSVHDSGSSTKRERSDDSRDVQGKAAGTVANRANGLLSKPIVKIPSYLDKSKGEISQAFQDLEWKQRFRLFHALENPNTSPFRVDRSEIVINRNRYGNVQPWDNCRVKLETPLDGSDYVNASPITLRSRAITKRQNSTDSISESSQESRYIATQGPKDVSTTHFWHMVMQQTIGDTGVVIMLTQCYESSREKCSQYYPLSLDNPTILLSPDEYADLESSQETVKAGTSSEVTEDNVTLTSITSDASTGTQLRMLKLTINNQSKTIYHYLFKGWADFGKPEGETRLALFELIRQSKRVAGKTPRIVHCSAGVGRTGTFIALDFIMHEIEQGRLTAQSPEKTQFSESDTSTSTDTWGKSGPPKVKTPTGGEFPSGEENQSLKDDLIYDVVNKLREQRMMMVMNEIQYAFIYEAIREIFLEKYRAKPEGAVVKSVEAGSTEMPRAKIFKIDEGDGTGGSVSEAETEIMDGDEEAAKREAKQKAEKEGDPYAAVAPHYFRGGLSSKKQKG